MQAISGVAQGCQNIAAGSLEVIGFAIKGKVVGVPRGRAGAMRVGMAAKLTLYHTAGLLGTTSVWDTVDCSSCAITGTQALTFLTIPELFTTFPIASLVMTSAVCWWHALVAIEDKTIITLATLLTQCVTGEGEGKAWTGGWTSCSTEFIMAV